MPCQLDIHHFTRPIDTRIGGLTAGFVGGLSAWREVMNKATLKRPREQSLLRIEEDSSSLLD